MIQYSHSYWSQHLENEKNEMFQKINFADPNLLQDKINEISNGLELFMKYKKYEHQQEHRLVWFSGQKIEQGIKVHCPEAIRYCEKIIF